jgi:hypothetical protein
VPYKAKHIFGRVFSILPDLLFLKYAQDLPGIPMGIRMGISMGIPLAIPIGTTMAIPMFIHIGIIIFDLVLSEKYRALISRWAHFSFGAGGPGPRAGPS